LVLPSPIVRGKLARVRLFYATTAPADFINAHKAWVAGAHYEREVAVTFSSHVEDFVSKVGGQALMISGHADGKQLVDGAIEIRHLPKRPASGWRWHIEEQ
jgi:hypothetical protein